MASDREFGSCGNCGRRLDEPSNDGLCESRESCDARAAHFIEVSLIESAREDARRLWDCTRSVW